MLTAATWPGLIAPQLELEPNDTLDAAQDVGHVGRQHAAEFVGRIGNGTDRSTDVDWFRFTLDAASRVQILSLPDAGHANTPVVVTLYGDQLAEFDPSVPLQHRLLGRHEGTANGQAAQVDVSLDAGTYFVAVSGAGNRYFHPFVADSGSPAVTSDYGLRISVAAGSPARGQSDQFAPVAEQKSEGDDTPGTGTDLGDLTSLGRLQVGGAIGDDPFYDVMSEDPFAQNSAADVDLYHFSITGDGQFALVAEALAGRIGSPLDPALTLYRSDEFGGLQLVASNNNTLNPMETMNGLFPFFADAALFSGLSAGEYFLAVSSSGNDVDSDPDGVFDPHSAHSGVSG
ncbi:MAG TPA: DVUA0089 family protein, partial [Planctomycetaceae bacterium]|nr:DVUA0089 family protein [Planctomycetaceae bacterium]